MTAPLLLLLSMAWGQDCPPASSTDLSASIDEAEATIARLDVPAFKAATDELSALIPCLDDPVTRQVAAEVHRLPLLLLLFLLGVERLPLTALAGEAEAGVGRHHEFRAR